MSDCEDGELTPAAAMRRRVDVILAPVRTDGLPDIALIRDLGLAAAIKAWTGVLDGSYEIRHADDAMKVAKGSIDILRTIAEEVGGKEDESTLQPEEARRRLTDFTRQIRRKAGEPDES